MGGHDRTVEQKLAAIAGRQHGVASRRQLILAGVSERQIDRRLASGGLIRTYRGVYRVGHGAPSVEADYIGAVLACGQGALLSGSAAAYLYSLIKGLPPVPEVTAATERRVAGIVAHRSRSMDRRGASEIFRVPPQNGACGPGRTPG